MAVRRWLWWVVKPLVFFACLTPLALLLYWVQTGQTSANPLDDITDHTGDWTIRFIMITLAVTPLRRLTNWNSLNRFRRMFGLFAFFYGILHFTTYVWFDKQFDWSAVVEDIPKRPFITVGFTALVLMLPLTLTSTKKWIARLGGKRWNYLHRLIYVTGILAVLHYLWLVKLNIERPLAYGALLATLLGFRMWHAVRGRVVES